MQDLLDLKATNEVAERYLEAITKYPLDANLATEVVPAAVKAVHEGIKVTGIIGVKEGKLEEALNRSVNMMVMFQSVEGFEYDGIKPVVR